MDEEPKQPANPVIPPPDIPKPTIPPPTIPPPSLPVRETPAARPVAGPVNVRIREAGDTTVDDEPKAGGLAPFNTRIIAALIDVVLAIGLQVSALWLLPGFAERIAWLVGIGYLVTRDSLPFLGGQSVGKKAMKLKVVTMEGKLITGNWEASLIRNGILLILPFGFIELFVLLTREDKPERGRRLGDEWAKTKVIIADDPPPAATDSPD